MGVVKSYVFFFIILVKLQHIATQPIFESLFCDFLCDDDDDSSSDYDFCDACSSGSSPSKQKDITTSTVLPDQEINIKIPASQGTVLDIINKNGAFSVLVDAQGSGSSTPASGASTSAPTTAAGGTTTAAATTTAKK